MDFTRPTATRLFLFLSLLAFGGLYNTCSAMAPSADNFMKTNKAAYDAAVQDGIRQAKDAKDATALNEIIGGVVGNFLNTAFAPYWKTETTKVANAAKEAEEKRLEAQAEQQRLAKVEEERKAAEALKKQQEAEKARLEAEEKEKEEKRVEQQRKDKEEEEDRKKAAAAKPAPVPVAAAPAKEEAKGAGAAVSSDMRTAIEKLAKDTAGQTEDDKVDSTDNVIAKIVDLPTPEQQPALDYLKQALGLKSVEAKALIDTTFNAQLDAKKRLAQ